jgi:hypothetical protein
VVVFLPNGPCCRYRSIVNVPLCNDNTTIVSGLGVRFCSVMTKIINHSKGLGCKVMLCIYNTTISTAWTIREKNYHNLNRSAI